MVGDHSWQMKTQIRTVGEVGVHRRWISLITNPLNCWAPVPQSQIKMVSLFLANFATAPPSPTQANIRKIGKIWNGRQKVKSPIVWDFPDLWKQGFRAYYVLSLKVVTELSTEEDLKKYLNVFIFKVIFTFMYSHSSSLLKVSTLKPWFKHKTWRTTRRN